MTTASLLRSLIFTLFLSYSSGMLDGATGAVPIREIYLVDDLCKTKLACVQCKMKPH